MLTLPYEKELKDYKLILREIGNTDFEFFSKFKAKGKQGIAGIVRIGDVGYAVFKISQYVDHLIDHEYLVMKNLNVLQEYCPHFCKAYIHKTLSLSSNYLSLSNPFEKDKNHPSIQVSVMFMEYIEKSKKLYNLITDNSIDNSVIFSVIKQVLLGVLFAQEYQFTHYDLHSSNILIRNCDEDDLFLYILDENNQFLVPTYGYYPVIIDFGFSHISSMKGNYCYASMGHTDIGFTSSNFDRISDSKLFLTSVSSELKEIRKKSKDISTLSNLVSNIFSPLRIDFSCGWDNVEEMSVADLITSTVSEEGNESSLFRKKPYIIIDGIISLIRLPFRQKEIKGLTSTFGAMISEFIKIESQVGSKEYQAYIFYGIIEAARKVSSDYLSKEGRRSAISKFRDLVFESINSVAKFCNPKDVNYEKLLCSLLLTSRCIEGILYEYLSLLFSTKEKKEYSKLRLKTTQEIYGAIDINIPSNFSFSKKSRIFVWDKKNKTRDNFVLSDSEIKELNKAKPHLRGSLAYDIYMTKGIDFPDDDYKDEESPVSECEKERDEEREIHSPLLIKKSSLSIRKSPTPIKSIVKKTENPLPNDKPLHPPKKRGRPRKNNLPNLLELG